MAEDTPKPGDQIRRTTAPGSIGAFSLFGLPVRMHFTFILLLILLMFLGIGQRLSGLVTFVYLMALFTSFLLHELGHILVARTTGIHTREIVLYPVGGISRMERLPKGSEEFWIALAGPVVNVLIALAIWAILLTQGATLAPIERLLEPSDENVWQRIAFGNLILAGFNLLPAFPMDGGRIVRSLLVRFKPEDQATQVATRSGRFLAVFLTLYGLTSSNFLMVFAGFLVYLGASQESTAVTNRSLTAGYPVRAAMITDFKTLSHGDTLRDAGELTLAKAQHDIPVTTGDQVAGLLTRNGLIRGMQKNGPESYVAGAMERNFLRFSPDLDLSEVLTHLSGSNPCALVMDGERLVGILTLENVSQFVQLRQAKLAQARAQER